MAYIAGAFAATYAPLGSGAASIGQTRDGFRNLDRHFHQDIIIDYAGEAPVSGVQQGTMTEVTLDYTEYDLILAALYAQNGGTAYRGQVVTKVGCRLTDLSGILVLTATANTPAALAPAPFKIRTYHKAIIITDVAVLLASRLRQGPCTFRCFPNASGLTYTDTAP